jgi:hypothetical protein
MRMLQISALLGCYAASCGKWLPTLTGFQSLRTPSLIKSTLRFAGYPFFSYSWSLKMGPIRFPETSVNNYHTTPRNISEERRSHQHRGGSLKSRMGLLVCHEEVLKEKGRSLSWEFSPCFLQDIFTNWCIAIFTVGQWKWGSRWPGYSSKGSGPSSLNSHLFEILYLCTFCVYEYIFGEN